MTLIDMHTNTFTHTFTCLLTYFLKINKTIFRENKSKFTLKNNSKTIECPYYPPVPMKIYKEILLWFCSTMNSNLPEPKITGSIIINS